MALSVMGFRLRHELMWSSLWDSLFAPSTIQHPPQVVAEATTLRLSYKNVLKIDNLQGFSRLTKLCLDNNIIESIRQVRYRPSLSSKPSFVAQMYNTCRYMHRCVAAVRLD